MEEHTFIEYGRRHWIMARPFRKPSFHDSSVVASGLVLDSRDSTSGLGVRTLRSQTPPLRVNNDVTKKWWSISTIPNSSSHPPRLRYLNPTLFASRIDCTSSMKASNESTSWPSSCVTRKFRVVFDQLNIPEVATNNPLHAIL